MTTKEKAREWLNRYQAGDEKSRNITCETIAEVFAEYLYESEKCRPDYEAEFNRVEADFKRVSVQNEELKARIEELKEQLEESEHALQASRNEWEYMNRQLIEAHGKIEAFKFCIRCNGVSGAEVRS